MRYSEVKQEIDEFILNKFGAGFDFDSIEVAYIDIDYDGVTSIEIEMINDTPHLRVT